MKKKAARSPLFEAGGKRRRAARPAPQARDAAHPQERQHSAAEGGTRDRVRPAGALHMRHLRHALRQGPSPRWAETRVEMVANYGRSARLRAPRA